MAVSCSPSLAPNHPPDWQGLKGKIREQFGAVVFKRWLEPLALQKWGSEVQLSLPTRFMKDWVDSHYTDKLLALFKEADTQVVQIHLTVESPLSIAIPLQEAAGVMPSASDKIIHTRFGNNPGEAAGDPLAAHLHRLLPTQAGQQQTGQQQGGQQAHPHATGNMLVGNAIVQDDMSSPLDPRFTFDRFVVGKPNELACVAAKRVAEAAQVSFNPLYLYGGVGLGKTHLMHAIAWHIRTHTPHRRVLYLSAEKFMYQFVRALRFKDTMQFKEQFRNIDVLMIDDIQFISGKDSTQEEFFHTFNALVDQNRQVVISADRPPSDLEKIEDRLRSRLGWGLCADLHPTTYDLRHGILHTKSEALKCKVPEKVLEFLAHRITSNVRELEGALNRIIAHSQLIGRAITLETAQELLQDLLRSSNRRISIDDIQKKVAEHYNVKITDMQSPRRARVVARPRQVAMYLAKQLTTRSLPEIGRKFGGRDHTTVIHAVRKIESLRIADVSLSEDVELLKRLLQNA